MEAKGLSCPLKPESWELDCYLSRLSDVTVLTAESALLPPSPYSGGIIHSEPCMENTLQTNGAEVRLVESFLQYASSGFQRPARLSCAAVTEEKPGLLFPPPGKKERGIARWCCSWRPWQSGGRVGLSPRLWLPPCTGRARAKETPPVLGGSSTRPLVLCLSK